jgi:lipid II isoglutaminyl synthase (glutamine-hydrolysing)
LTLMQRIAGTLLGKLVRSGLLLRPGGGHALPGLVVDKILPGYTSAMLKQLPGGVVYVTGTNGKTTTTKALVQILQAKGKRVLTNPTGSNMVRGVASTLIQSSGLSGKLSYDMAVLEVDEASVRPLIHKVKPRWVLALNVSRDQLDRFGEVDTIAAHIGSAMMAATEGIVTNAADPHLVNHAKAAAKQKAVALHYFGASPKLREYFPSDYELAAVKKSISTPDSPAKLSIDVVLADFSGQLVTYLIDGKKYQAELKLTGQHNFLNGAAALAVALRLLPEVEPAELLAELAKVSIAFGRGETYRLDNGAVVELVLVKNPASFRQALASYASADNNLMIAINDNIADGRDVSWLWDVDFSPLKGRKVAITSGSRAADMALRLKYEDIEVGKIEPHLEKALLQFAKPGSANIMLVTYTAMLSLYKLLSKSAEGQL